MAAPKTQSPVFFPTSAAFREWLAAHHDTADEIIVGFYRKHTGKPSMTWQEAVDQALCFGWIDGIRRRWDDDRYSNRFTPRRKGSNWSAINIRRVGELKKLGLMQPAGLAAFALRTDARSAIYAYEQRKTLAFTPAQLARFRRHPDAWTFFQAQPPSYRQLSTYWVLSAVKPETRDRRLDTLIATSAKKQRR